MMRSARFCVSWAVLVAFCASPEAVAQIDYRADQRARSANGHLLDRNPQVGSGGYNQPHVAGSSAGRQAGAIITGNVTGLARFHAQTPVLQNNRFRGPLPSSGLSGFLAETVGPAQVLSNRALRSTFYFGRAETFSDLGFLRGGLTRPGSSQLISPLSRPPTISAPRIAPSLTSIRDPADLRVDQDPMLANIGIRQRPIGPATESAVNGEAASSPFGQAVGSSIFGTPMPSVSIHRQPASGQARDMPQLNPHPNDLLTPFSATGVDLTPPQTGLGSNAAIQQMPATTAGRLQSPQAVGGSTASPQAGLPGGVTSPSPLGLLQISPPNLGQDRFTDMARAVQAAEQLGLDRLGFLGRGPAGQEKPVAQGEAKQPTARGISPSSPLARTGLARSRDDRGVAELATGVKWADDLLKHPIKSFVGKYQNRLNGYMAAAEEALHKGQYYRAAGRYELASTVDPSNPLPWLGRGNALLAAGDYVSALFSIEKGIRLFPQIAAFRLDLPALVGQHDVFDLRRADLEDRLAQSEHYEMRFLLGYLELYSGLQAEGLKDLEQAAREAPPDRVIAIFPDLILGRRVMGSPARLP